MPAPWHLSRFPQKTTTALPKDDSVLELAWRQAEAEGARGKLLH